VEIVGRIIWYALLIYFLLLIFRLIMDFVFQFARSYEPRGVMLVALEVSLHAALKRFRAEIPLKHCQYATAFAVGDVVEGIQDLAGRVDGLSDLARRMQGIGRHGAESAVLKIEICAMCVPVVMCAR